MQELNAHSVWQKTRLQMRDAQQQLFYVMFRISSITLFVIYKFSQILVGKCACILKLYNGVTELLLFL